jgi:hypothetical protein
MKNQKISGIGCYAKPEKLRRIFRKMVNNYALGQFEKFELINSHESDGKMLLKALIDGNTGCSTWRWPNIGDVLEENGVTGFFLTLRDQKLKLSIFSKGAGDGKEKYTADLDELTRIRRKRLN